MDQVRLNWVDSPSPNRAYNPKIARPTAERPIPKKHEEDDEKSEEIEGQRRKRLRSRRADPSLAASLGLDLGRRQPSPGGGSAAASFLSSSTRHWASRTSFRMRGLNLPPRAHCLANHHLRRQRKSQTTRKNPRKAKDKDDQKDPYIGGHRMP
ncbi:hypothetical protein BLNAU_23418 [Blattamonas nauphoetae]|uniref:Uncharacterized protein n=1 Tax=Blattamonas nauphoetae TaxID=2049346 RepID=A0ABQ9WQT3_9EUKA|nr:hypothetical protein BLNAU_23418 [Blattamonas nauphoetae]